MQITLEVQPEQIPAILHFIEGAQEEEVKQITSTNGDTHKVIAVLKNLQSKIYRGLQHEPQRTK